MTFYENYWKLTHSFLLTINSYYNIFLSSCPTSSCIGARMAVLVGDGTKYESKKSLVFDDLSVTLLPS